MTVAFKSTPSPQRRPSRPLHLPATQSKVVPLEQAREKRVTASLTNSAPLVSSPSPQSSKSVVKVLPKPQPQPLWLSSMMVLQRVSSVFTSLIIGSTLTVYGLTVYRESSWTQEYPRLEQLRLQEQQLRATQEVLKNQIAIAADEPTTGLVVPQPSDMIYVEPAAPRPEQSVAPTPLLELNHSPNPEADKPLGY
ncbi:conserved hypothetical protein [Planktothrix serta PCC 8927]|uniref:Cell division protein FtsL n=1 Tax=Planktothrix serta PCC 8927 TaxID=671068 RepID=A0A7Z9DVP6_9CYAN|nr:hypothetical protein [Planktothrix serta]VXD13858.1 conserved hypothetical protein [Planktothrix serta PCC 8927]